MRVSVNVRNHYSCPNCGRIMITRRTKLFFGSHFLQCKSCGSTVKTDFTPWKEANFWTKLSRTIAYLTFPYLGSFLGVLYLLNWLSLVIMFYFFTTVIKDDSLPPYIWLLEFWPMILAAIWPSIMCILFIRQVKDSNK